MQKSVVAKLPLNAGLTRVSLTMTKSIMSLEVWLNSLENSNRVLFSMYDGKFFEDIRAHEFMVLIGRWQDTLESYDDEIIPIFGRMTPDMLAAYIAVMALGKKPVFISYPSTKISPEDYLIKLENYSDHFDSTIFIGEKTDKAITDSIVTPDDLSSSSNPRWNPRGHEDLFLQCSSGSTGLQKAVCIQEHKLNAQLDLYGSALELDSSDRIISWLPLYHDIGLITTFFLPLLSNIEVVYIDPFTWIVNPKLLLQAIESRQGTLCWLPNFAFKFLTRVGPTFDLSSMKAFINCSEPCTQDAFAEFSEHFTVPPEKLAVSYALAENVFAVTQTPIGKSPKILHVDEASYLRSTIVPTDVGGKVLVSCGTIL